MGAATNACYVPLKLFRVKNDFGGTDGIIGRRRCRTGERARVGVCDGPWEGYGVVDGSSAGLVEEVRDGAREMVTEPEPEKAAE